MVIKKKMFRRDFIYQKNLPMNFYGGLGINKIFSFNKIDIGGSLAVWKQPELFSDYPATAE